MIMGCVTGRGTAAVPSTATVLHRYLNFVPGWPTCPFFGQFSKKCPFESLNVRKNFEKTGQLFFVRFNKKAKTW